MKPLLLLAAFLLLAAAASVEAQGIYEPERGSPERQAILDAVHDNAHDALGLSGAIAFYDVTLRATGDWALVNAEPRRPDGAKIGHCTSEDGAYDEGDPNIVALLYRSGGRWHVVESATCATDVWYLHWPDRYGAPHPLGIPAPAPFPRSASVSPTDDGFFPFEPSLASTEVSASRAYRAAPTFVCWGATPRQSGSRAIGAGGAGFSTEGSRVGRSARTSSWTEVDPDHRYR